MGRYTINKYISRLMALLLAMLLLFSSVPAVSAEGESGSCGGNLSWSLSAGTLTISGSGDMDNFTEAEMAPWYDVRGEIVRLVLPEGLTSVGSLAFYGCENLTAVVIPDSVKRIGNYAFAGCAELAMLNLGEGVQTIGESAFSDCVSLAALRLPDGLQTIGVKAFYRCESITTLTVPLNVRTIGLSAFGYCKSLVFADIRANIDVVPEFLFYGCHLLSTVILPDTTGTISEFAFRGCDNLSSVHYGGAGMSQEEIQQLIDADVSGFGSTGFVTDSAPSESVTSGIAAENGDGTVTQENITVTQGSDSTVSAKVEHTRPEDTINGGTFDADISVTVDGAKGWDEALKTVENTLKELNSTATATGGEVNDVQIQLYLTGTNTVDQAFIDAMAQRSVTLSVMTQNGASWRMDCSAMNAEEMSGEYNLSYTVSAGDQSLLDELEAMSAFVLRFASYAEVNAEVLIQLGEVWARQPATLFQRVDGELVRHQTVVVDAQGYAHFYLGSVTEETDYYIAMNLPTVQEEAIIPDELLPEYGYPEPIRTLDYVITGTKSSWGMNINQVTWIMVGVLAAVVIGVGITMYALNKRKLKLGYIPDIDDEDYE